MSCNTVGLPASGAPVLSSALLARVRELNLDYLELLCTEYACRVGSSGQLHHLPPKLHAALADMPQEARSSLASMPYTLYSLGFEREAFWRSVSATNAAPVAEPIEQRYAPIRAGRLQDPFCVVALLFAWHVAMSNRLASRVAFAMPDATAQRLLGMPLWCIRRVAAEHPTLLMPRWPTNPGFWPDLVRFAASGDERRLATVKLLGSQLIAAELELAGASQERAQAQHWTRSPRLRAHKLQM
jgi:hypothetical protein